MKLIVLNAKKPSGIKQDVAIGHINRLGLDFTVTYAQSDGDYVVSFSTPIEGLRFADRLKQLSVTFAMHDTTEKQLPQKLMELLPRLAEERGLSSGRDPEAQRMRAKTIDKVVDDMLSSMKSPFGL